MTQKVKPEKVGEEVLLLERVHKEELIASINKLVAKAKVRELRLVLQFVSNVIKT